MKTIIHERVELANQNKLPSAVIKLKSGWVVLADQQPLQGYCLLLSDPVVSSLNEMSEAARAQYLLDTTRVGDALLECTEAIRINYETWCNKDPALHTHVVPRYKDEAEDVRTLPMCKGYDVTKARPFDPALDGALILRLRQFLARFV